MRYRAGVGGLLVALLAACQADVAGPQANVLLGEFGATDVRTELWATHTGIELDDGCMYFVSSEPALLATDASFEVDGRYQGSGRVIGTSPARLAGRVTSGNGASTVTLTLTLLDVRPPAMQAPLVLTRNTHYTGDPFPCPA
jgi:hypothetical protein